jgi:hypothetical protein
MQMKGKAREAASLGKDSQWGLRPPPRAAHGLDADDGRDRGDLEPPPGIAEVLLHRRNIEPAGDLLRDPDGEAVTGGLEQPTPLDFVLECLALDFGALKHRVGIAERVSQRRVRGIVETGCGRQIGSLGHGIILLAWVRAGQEHGRPEAIRRLLEQALSTAATSAPAKAGSRRKAAQLAGRAADALGDQTATVEECAHRRRRLIKGPREFRVVRGDQPEQKG